MGENIDGQLGLSSISNADSPQKVPNIPIIVTHVRYNLKLLLTYLSQIATGRNHVFAISSELRQVYGWGSNSFGQLALKNKGQCVLSPKLITGLIEFDPFRVIIIYL